MPCHRVYHAVDSSHHHQASFPEACKNYLWGTKSAELAADSRAHGDNFHQAEERDTSHVNEAGFGDDYVPMSTLPSILLGMERKLTADCTRTNRWGLSVRGMPLTGRVCCKKLAVDWVCHQMEPGYSGKPLTTLPWSEKLPTIPACCSG
ncbi:putative ubiquitin carboxyl-terminal hydrolase 21-like [Sciurus carolinensis]|uniref:Ubiquitin carboxyl-terminal hydrolase 21-like n=1 Tax=Sciurus carolinensis TaxID=30640 RepID=A0AA41ML18_SCICA|nr:putative ubiquitin carboxyl-terminal hydrolase 21-like [Sciurus carolinensis]